MSGNGGFFWDASDEIWLKRYYMDVTTVIKDGIYPSSKVTKSEVLATCSAEGGLMHCAGILGGNEGTTE